MKTHQSCESKKSVITVPLTDPHPLCVLLFLMPADCGWPCWGSRGVGLLPCLHTNWQSEKAHRGQRVFDDQLSKKREKALWRNGFHPLSLCISQSLPISLVMMMRSNQQTQNALNHWRELLTLLHVIQRGFVLTAYEQAAHQKTSFSSFIHNLPTSHASLCLFMLHLSVRQRVCVCVSLCLWGMLYLSALGNWWDINVWEHCRSLRGKMEDLMESGCPVLESWHSSLVLLLIPGDGSSQLSQTTSGEKSGNDVPKSKGKCLLLRIYLAFFSWMHNVITLQVWASVAVLFRTTSLCPVASSLSCSDKLIQW